MPHQKNTQQIHQQHDAIDFPAMLGLIALEKTPNGEFNLLSSPPVWAGAIFPEINEHSATVKLTEDLTFLANFLDDCEGIWMGSEDRSIISGPWIEVDASSTEYALEARGLLWNNRKILLIERINESYSLQQAIVQRARENFLLQLELEKELERKKRLERDLVKALEAAEKANREKSEFISTISHELRTPLNSILGFTQICLFDRNATLAATHVANLNMVVSGGKHLLKLIDELLEISRIESGNIAVTVEQVSPSRALQDSLSLVQILADEREISLVYDELPASIIKADFDKLKQVFINLLSNAIKYSHKGSTVFIKETIENNEVYRLMVTDTGIGIAEENLKHLFTRYSRLGQEHSTIQGVGIGLAFTKKIVEEMSGRVGVESREGFGSSFWVEFTLENQSKQTLV